jgi:hypothetical protein
MIVRSLAWGLVALLACPTLAPALADGDTNVAVRVGTHDGYGRVVFDLPSRSDYHVTQQGQRVVVQFDGNLTISTARGVPRNVISITGGAGQAELVMAPGTSLHSWRLGDMVVIDVLDREAAGGASAEKQAAAKPAAIGPPPPPDAPRAPSVATEPTPAAPPVLKPGPPATPPTSEAAKPQAEVPAAASQTPPSAPAPPPPEAPQPTPDASVAETATQPATTSEPGLVVPADPQLGVAVFRRGNTAVIVFDRPRTIDTDPLRDDPVFATAAVQTLPTATVIRVQLDAGKALSVTRLARAWQITTVATEPRLRPIQATVADDRLALPAASGGSVVSIEDPMTGATLLVGTQRREGQGVPAQHRAPEFTLLPTWQGVAVEPIADSVILRPTPQGFVLGDGLALSPRSDVVDQLAHAAGLTRQYDFPNQPIAVLLQRLQRQIAEDVTTKPLARGPSRQAIARTMIALGFGAEAGAILHMAAADDPHVAGSPDNPALASIAALLAHRPSEADGLLDARLPEADDVALWRAVRLAQLQEGSSAAAAMLAATLPLLLAYPAEIRDRLLPLIAETLVDGGETDAAAALLDARKDDSALEFARAMLQEARGDTAKALASYEQLARSRDQLVHARAARRVVELRLATGAIDARQAADALESLLYSWRGDQQERALRDRLAELKMRVGQWRAGLNLMRESEALFPDDKVAIHAALADMFTAMLREDAADALTPLDMVSVVEENTDLLPSGPDGEVLQAKLADRLLTLDLPKRASEVLETLTKAAKSGVARAGFGARLAALRLREGDPAGAMGALDASVAPDLPAELAERRTLLVAAADARRGDDDAALAALGTLDSAAADEARATVLERSSKWPEAQRALASYVARTVPAEGRLDDNQRRTLLRLATAAARAGDDAALAALRQHEGPRMQGGPLGDMFRLLTADQVRGVADLKRSGQEAALARALPADLKALLPPAPPAK